MSDTIQRGQVWEYTSGPHRHRGVIISGDGFNASSGALPWALPIGPAQGNTGSGYVVTLARHDPGWPGLVWVPKVMRVDPTAFLRLLGPLSPATMAAVDLAFRTVAGVI